MLETTYINVHGETLRLKCDRETKHIQFHHSDIHEKGDEYQDVSFAQQYYFNDDERKVIAAFMKLALDVMY